MPIKSYAFFDNYRLRVPIWSGGASADVKQDVTWEEDKTIINSATLRMKIFASGGTQGRISLNGRELAFCDATFADAKIAPELDIKGILINGNNVVLIELWKNPYLPLEKIGDFSAELILNYTGVDPKVKPWWQKYLIPTAIGVSCLIVGVGIAFLVKK